MSKSSAILILIEGEGLLKGFSNSGQVEVYESPSSSRSFSFGSSFMNVAVPERSIDLFGSGGFGTASFSVSSQDLSIASLVGSGISIKGLKCTIKNYQEDMYWSEAPLLFSGFVSSASFDPYSEVVDVSLKSEEQSVNTQFPSSRVGDKGRFESPPSNTFDRILPVVYGSVINMPVPAVSFEHSASGAGTVRVCVAAHNVYGSPDRQGFVKIGNNELGDMSAWYEIKSDVDGLGQPYSFISIPLELWDDGIYVREMSGKVTSSGSRLEGLGDIVQDIWSSYSQYNPEAFDSARSSFATTKLNMFSVGISFTDASEGQTLFDLLVGRLGDLPFSFSAPIGLFGWDATVIPSESEPRSGKLQFGVNIFERGEIKIEGYDKIQNRFKVSFSYDNNSEGNTESIIIDETNSGLCRTSQSRYGKSKVREISAPDVVTPFSVGALISAEVNKFAVPRLSMSYYTDDLSFLKKPLLTVFDVTDEDAGIFDQPFFLESVSHDVDNDGCFLALRSIKSIDSTLQGEHTNAKNS
mgnify:CR=1 FL=1|tara:strand:+ start:228 stop:1799 length:1572 start_codon:yes stop_codon:yes gene_type:complete